MALKSLKGTDDSVSAIADKKLIAEGRIMGQFDNKNIVKLFGSVIFCNSVSSSANMGAPQQCK